MPLRYFRHLSLSLRWWWALCQSFAPQPRNWDPWSSVHSVLSSPLSRAWGFAAWVVLRSEPGVVYPAIIHPSIHPCIQSSVHSSMYTFFRTFVHLSSEFHGNISLMWQLTGRRIGTHEWNTVIHLHWYETNKRFEERSWMLWYLFLHIYFIFQRCEEPWIFLNVCMYGLLVTLVSKNKAFIPNFYQINIFIFKISCNETKWDP